MIKQLFFNIVFSILNLLGKIFSFFYSYSFSQKLILIKSIIYTSWISREFKSIGVNTRIYPKFNLLGGEFITLGNNCVISSNTVLTAWNKHKSNFYTPEIIIGNNVSIGEDSHITAINKIHIGNNVLTGKKITISDNSHGTSNFESISLPPAERKLFSKGAIIIEDGVWIGEKVTILSNVRIGRNSIIGANAVVSSDLPANCIAVGVPARIIKIINDENSK